MLRKVLKKPTTLAEVLRAWQDVEQNYLDYAAEAMGENAEEGTNYNREQMFKGVTSDEKRITPEYRPATVREKRKKGDPSDRVTLSDTGRFYEGMFLRVDTVTYTFDSDDPKTEKLRKKYGDKIFGLTSESKRAWYREWVRLTMLQLWAIRTGAILG